MTLCTAAAAISLSVWGAGRAASVVRSLPLVVPRRLAATATLAAIGLLVGPRSPAAADPVPPMVRLADAHVEPSGPIEAQPVQIHRVEPGDSLWRIAATTLGRRKETTPTNREVAGFWPRIYDANESVIGGDPDLILPGQRLIIPEP
jgi:nucleoid-associated protein YgaU